LGFPQMNKSGTSTKYRSIVSSIKTILEIPNAKLN
jgi:hypothetical protein